MVEVIKTIVFKGREFHVWKITNTHKDGSPAPEPIYFGQVRAKDGPGFVFFEVYESYFTGKKNIGQLNKQIDEILLLTLKVLFDYKPDRYWAEFEVEKHLADQDRNVLVRAGTPRFISRLAKLARDGKVDSSYIETPGYSKVNTYRYKS